MNYILFNADGSINTQHLDYYIMQGSVGVNEIFVSVNGTDNTNVVTALFVLPNHATSTIAGVYQADYEYATGETANGWLITLSSTETLYNGLLKMSVLVYTGTTLLLTTYPVALVVNETGYRPDADTGVTIEEINSYLVQLQSYQLKYDLANVRGYNTLALATADLPNLADGQIVIVKGDNATFYQVQSGSLVELISDKADKAYKDGDGLVIKSTYGVSVVLSYDSATDTIISKLYASDGTLLDTHSVALPKATTTKNGLMAKEDKVKVDALATTYETIVNSDAKVKVLGNYSTREAMLTAVNTDAKGSGLYLATNNYDSNIVKQLIYKADANKVLIIGGVYGDQIVQYSYNSLGGSWSVGTSFATKPWVNTQLTAKQSTSEKGQPNGYASLDSGGKVPSTQLPSYVDDVLEYANLASFPATGSASVIYVALDTNLTYRWSGSAYVEISPSLALGETAETAYRGDRGKTAYDHSQITDGSNPHGTTFSSLASKPTTLSGFGITDAYTKAYIDSLKDMNGWESELITLTPLTNGQTIALATLQQYDIIKLFARNTSTNEIDTDSFDTSIGLVNDYEYRLFDNANIKFVIGATNCTFTDTVGGYELQIIGQKYTDLPIDDFLSDVSENPVQNKIITAKINTLVKKAKGWNLLEGIAPELGTRYVNGTTPSTNADYNAFKYLDVIGGKTYYFYSQYDTGHNVRNVEWLDASKAFISENTYAQSATAPSNARYAIVSILAESGSSGECYITDVKPDFRLEYIEKDIRIDEGQVDAWFSGQAYDYARLGYVNKTTGEWVNNTVFTSFVLQNPKYKTIKIVTGCTSATPALALFFSGETISLASLMSDYTKEYTVNNKGGLYEFIVSVPDGCKTIVICSSNAYVDDTEILIPVAYGFEKMGKPSLVVETTALSANNVNFPITIKQGQLVRVSVSSISGEDAAYKYILFGNSTNYKNMLTISKAGVYYFVAREDYSACYTPRNANNSAFDVWVDEKYNAGIDTNTAECSLQVGNKTNVQNDVKWFYGVWEADAKTLNVSTIRLTTEIIPLCGGYVSASVGAESGFSVWIYAYDGNGAKTYVSGKDISCFISNNCVGFAIQIKRDAGSDWLYYPDDITNSGVSFSYNNMFYSQKKVNDNVKGEIEELDKKTLDLVYNPFKYTKYYYHFFIDMLSVNSPTVIPCQSVYDVRVCKRMGFNVVQTNVLKTATPGKYICMHGLSGKMDGRLVVKNNEEEPLPDTPVNQISFEDLRNDYVYRSLYSKYKTPITELREWLHEVKMQKLYPMVQYVDDDEIAIVREMFGDNFIQYGGHRGKHNTNGTGTHNWIMTFDNFDLDMMKYKLLVDGAPFMFNFISTNNFTDEELKEMVDFAHENGCLIGTAYQEDNPQEIQRCWELGFDYYSTITYVEDFNDGNLASIHCDVDFNEVQHNGSVSNNNLVLSTGQIVSWQGTSPQFLGKESLSIRFNGELKFNLPNRVWVDKVISSNGESVVTLSTYFINGQVPSFSAEATENTTIYEIRFNASKC